jgi:hypothetical protein
MEIQPCSIEVPGYKNMHNYMGSEALEFMSSGKIAFLSLVLENSISIIANLGFLGF